MSNVRILNIFLGLFLVVLPSMAMPHDVEDCYQVDENVEYINVIDEGLCPSSKSLRTFSPITIRVRVLNTDSVNLVLSNRLLVNYIFVNKEQLFCVYRE